MHKKEKIQEENKKNIDLLERRKTAFHIEMEKRNIFTTSEYSNHEMVEQYRALFKVMGYFLGVEKFENDWKDNWNLYPESDFVRILREMKKYYEVLKVGVNGEEKVFDRIKLVDDKVEYISNYRCKVDDLDIEVDLILISENGIFAIEIKNWSTDSKIDDKGYLYNEKQKANIVEQLLRHCSGVRKLIRKGIDCADLSEVEVYPILLWVNEKSKITKNEFTQLPVCYLNQIQFEIFNKEKYNLCINEKMRHEIHSYLDKNRKEDRKYKCDINMEQLDIVIEEYIFQNIYSKIQETEDYLSGKTRRENLKKAGLNTFEKVYFIAKLLDL